MSDAKGKETPKVKEMTIEEKVDRLMTIVVSNVIPTINKQKETIDQLNEHLGIQKEKLKLYEEKLDFFKDKLNFIKEKGVK